MNSILTIAKNTLRETIRDRVLLSALVASMAIIFFTLFIGSISLDQGTRVIIDFSVTAIYALQMFVAIYIGSMLVYKEIERKTFYLILPKPIHRGAIIIGKCLGLTLTTILISVLPTLILLSILFLKGETMYTLPILVSILFSIFESVILILISLFFSLVTSPILASIGTLTLFFIGHASAIIERIFMTTESPFVGIIMKGVYYIFPNLEKFNLRNDIVYQLMPSLGIVVTTTLYALTYTAFLLFITNIVFKKKDF